MAVTAFAATAGSSGFLDFCPSPAFWALHLAPHDTAVQTSAQMTATMAQNLTLSQMPSISANSMANGNVINNKTQVAMRNRMMVISVPFADSVGAVVNSI